MKKAKYGFILLAAGRSSRMGEPKALLPYKGITLIEHIVRELLSLMHYPVIVVTGAHAESIGALLKVQPVTLVYNNRWQEGMASSIARGLEALQEISIVEGAIFVSCDQPAISADLFRSMLQKKITSGKSIVASAYGGTMGIPALFDKKHFPALQNLIGEKGAKSVLQQYEHDVARLDFQLGSQDIDTREDYAHALMQLKQ